jgi:hypothetical protein
MSEREIQIYDPPLCCPTGVCGPNIEPALIRFAADLEWAAEQGVRVARFNLAQQPGVFAETPEVLEVLEAHGEAGLPLVRVDGRTVMSGGYPTRAQLAGWLGLTLDGGGAGPGGCAPSSGCC